MANNDKIDYDKIFELIKSNKWDETYNYIQKFKEIDVNVRDNNDNHLLIFPIIQNNQKVTKLLLEKGANLDIFDNDGRSALYYPIKYDYYDVFNVIAQFNNINMGIPIVDLKDKFNNLPIHYAIQAKNIKIIDDLINLGSDLNAYNNDHYNSLHLAIFSRNINICEKIIKNKININALTKFKENALHIACNFKLLDIVKLLIINKIDIDQQDENEITPLLDSIIQNNNNITKMLLENGATVNVQDSIGNSAIHYAIIEENYEILNLLLSNSKLNFNLHNIYNKLPIHLILENDTIKTHTKLDPFIINSNLNFQDNNGNTPLHLLIKNKIWKQHHKILLNKKMNISIINKNNERPIDYFENNDPNDKKEFIDLLVNSYLNILSKSHDWENEWEQICSKKKYTIHDINILSKYDPSNKSHSNLCYNIIKNKIMEIIKDKHKKCKYTSYPTKKGKSCITINNNIEVDYCNFSGNIIDILIGLVYLLKKYKYACSVLDEELNFQIIWNGKKLILSNDFNKNFKKCTDDKTKRFIIIPLGIEIDEGNHSGYLIYDKLKNEIERFEPYGSTGYNYDYNSNLLDENIKNAFDKFKYFGPHSFMPKISFQYLDAIEENMKKIGDPFGFCALWSIWYVDKRLTYYDIDRKSLVKKLLKQIKLSNESFKNLIRNYSKTITNIRDQIFDKVGININKWINQQYTKEEYESTIKLIFHLDN
jgi:ankyrin repeat protein